MLTVPDHLPWWKSRVIIGALVSAALKMLYLTGWAGEIAPEDTEELIDVAVLLASFVGDFIAARARVKQDAAPPITIS